MRVLLALSVALVLAGAAYVLVGVLTSSRGIDLIGSNLQFSSLLFGNSLGWGTIGLGIAGLFLWLATQGVRRR